MIIAGLDWSMSCPAICVYDTSKKLSFENCMFFFYMDSKKFEGKLTKNIIGMKHSLYDGDQERYDQISDWGMAILRRFNVKEVCMEGYAMGASSGLVFNIAENGGLMKYKMWKEGIKISALPAPSAVKKLWTGKGNAKKDLMHSTLVEKESINLETLLNSSSLKSPISDIVDSYAMAQYLVNNPDTRF